MFQIEQWQKNHTNSSLLHSIHIPMVYQQILRLSTDDPDQTSG